MTRIEIAELVIRVRTKSFVAKQRQRRTPRERLEAPELIARNQRIVEMYTAGLSTTVIAKACSVSVPHVCRIARYAGIPPRRATQESK